MGLTIGGVIGSTVEVCWVLSFEGLVILVVRCRGIFGKRELLV